MKKNYFLAFLFFFAMSLIYAQTNRLENYQIASFNGVTRVSLTFTRRPITNVMKESNNLRVTINALQCEIGNVPARFTTPDMFASIMLISGPSRNLDIEITTTQPYELIRQFGSMGNRYIMHLDIIRVENPTRIEDIVSMLDYYHFIGNGEALNNLLQIAQRDFPDHPQLGNRLQNRFNPPIVYSPTPTRPQVAQATTVQRPVNTTPTQPPTQPRTDTPTPITQTPPQQQQQVTPPPQQTPPEPAPPTPPVEDTPPTIPQTTTNRNNIDPADVSFTLITRHDRFPTRIPQTKPLQTTQETIIPIEPEPIQPPEIIVQTEPVLPPEPIIQPDPEPIIQPDPVPIHQVEQPQIVYRDITDTTGLSETEQLIIRYYHVASVDSILVSYLVGASANIVGDFPTAIHFLSQVPHTDVNYENALRLLHDSYLSIGDTANASFFATLLRGDETTSDTETTDSPISLWMIIALGVLALGVGFVVAFIVLGAKKDKRAKEYRSRESIPEEDYTTHVSNIQKAYDNKPLNAPSTSITEIEKTESLADHYDDPPIITEELTIQETQELKQDEKAASSYGKAEQINQFPTKTEPPQDNKSKFDDDDYEAFGDDEYRKNLVLKLYRDGWKLEEIAKEVQISQREIDLIVKLSG